MEFRKASYSGSLGNCVEVGPWRKSSRSSPTGQCVEAADFRKASYSVHNGGCVEVASGVLVRDTTDRDGGMLTFTAGAWTAFLGTVKAQ